VPYRVAQGQLHVLTSEIPSEEMTRELSSVSFLEIRYRLLPPSELRQLADRYHRPWRRALRHASTRLPTRQA